MAVLQAMEDVLSCSREGPLRFDAKDILPLRP
jgi:hypothetical protein